MCENYRKKFECKSTANNSKRPNGMTVEQKEEKRKERKRTKNEKNERNE